MGCETDTFALRRNTTLNGQLITLWDFQLRNFWDLIPCRCPVGSSTVIIAPHQ